MKRIFIALTLALCLVACATGKQVPQPYYGAISKLRDRNIEIQKQLQDLEKQAQDLRTESNFNCQRMNTLAGEAVQKVGLRNGTVDVNTLTFKETK